MSGHHFRVQPKRLFDRRAHFLRIPFVGGFQHAERLRLPAHDVGQFEMRLRIGRVQSDRLSRQQRSAVEKGLFLVVSCNIVAVYRQRSGRQSIPFGGLEGCGEFGGMDEPAFGVRGARGFDRMGAGGACQQKYQQECLRDRRADQ